MATPPQPDNIVELHIRHMPGGLFTDQVFGVQQPALKVRQVLRVELPLGSFFLREESDKPIVFLASGTGFAPIKAMVEHMIERQMIHRPIRFYWGGRRPQDLYAAQIAKQWEQSVHDFQFIPVVSDALPEDEWQGRTGLVHHAVLEDFDSLAGYEVYACGHPQMVEGARRDFTRERQLEEEAYFSDAFTSEADKVSGSPPRTKGSYLTVAVVGPGLIGVATAWWLRQAGYEVCLIDRRPQIAHGSSRHTSGLISVGQAFPCAQHSTTRL